MGHNGWIAIDVSRKLNEREFAAACARELSPLCAEENAGQATDGLKAREVGLSGLRSSELRNPSAGRPKASLERFHDAFDYWMFKLSVLPTLLSREATVIVVFLSSPRGIFR
jgi:hypothetical protein